MGLGVVGCEKAWIHKGWEDTMQKRFDWLEDVKKKKDEKEKMKEMHQRKFAKMIKSAEGSAGLLHKITEPTAWRGGTRILKKSLPCCWTALKQRGKNGQSTGSVTKAFRTNQSFRVCKVNLATLKVATITSHRTHIFST